MGRRKGYERDEVLDKAMRRFWQQGFHATSTRELADAMGLNVYSLYAEFGSKEGLYDAAIGRYDDTVVERHFGKLEAQDAGLDAVHEVLDFFGEVAREGNPMLGCLMCNAITEQAPSADSSRRGAASYTGRLTRAFEHALGNARREGVLRADTPVTELAHFLVVSLLGLFVVLRAGGTHPMTHDTAVHAKARVEAFRS